MSDKLLILSPHKNFEEIKKIDDNGIEYWEARELMPLLEYRNWRDFHNTIKKSQIACSKSGQEAETHFEESLKMVTLGSGS